LSSRQKQFPYSFPSRHANSFAECRIISITAAAIPHMRQKTGVFWNWPAKKTSPDFFKVQAVDNSRMNLVGLSERNTNIGIKIG
jgi:hypothetical protein